MKTTIYFQTRKLLLAGVLAFVPFGVQGALISYEGFDYAFQSKLAGNQSDGWNSGWVDHAGGATISSNVTIGNSGLDYPASTNFTSTGNSGISVNGGVNMSAQFGTDFQFRFTESNTRYASYLINKPANQYFYMTLGNKDNLWSFGITSDNRFFVRGLNTVGSVTAAVESASIARAAGNTTYLIVSKLVTDSTGTNTLYLNWYGSGDIVPQEEPTSWMLSVQTNYDDPSLNTKLTLLMRPDAGAQPTYQFDEIRLGTSWDGVAVAPVPESPVALLGSAGVAVLWAFSTYRGKR